MLPLSLSLFLPPSLILVTHKCLGPNAKAPMKEQWPFLIGSCPDKRQVNLACEGAGPSPPSQLGRHSLTASRRRGGRGTGGWIDGDSTWMALSSALGSMPDRGEKRFPYSHQNDTNDNWKNKKSGGRLTSGGEFVGILCKLCTSGS